MKMEKFSLTFLVFVTFYFNPSFQDTEICSNLSELKQNIEEFSIQIDDIRREYQAFCAQVLEYSSNLRNSTVKKLQNALKTVAFTDRECSELLTAFENRTTDMIEAHSWSTNVFVNNIVKHDKQLLDSIKRQKEYYEKLYPQSENQIMNDIKNTCKTLDELLPFEVKSIAKFEKRKDREEFEKKLYQEELKILNCFKDSHVKRLQNEFEMERKYLKNVIDMVIPEIDDFAIKLLIDDFRNFVNEHEKARSQQILNMYTLLKQNPHRTKQCLNLLHELEQQSLLILSIATKNVETSMAEKLNHAKRNIFIAEDLDKELVNHELEVAACQSNGHDNCVENLRNKLPSIRKRVRRYTRQIKSSPKKTKDSIANLLHNYRVDAFVTDLEKELSKVEKCILT